MYKEAEQISAEVLEASPDDESALANQKAARNSLLHRSNSAGGGGAARPPEVYFFLLVPPSLAYLHLQPPPQDISYFSSLSNVLRDALLLCEVDSNCCLLPHRKSRRKCRTR